MRPRRQNPGKALRSLCHKDKSLIQPGKWDTSVGGHITFDEKISEALKREAWEEAGVVDGKFEHITDYLWECPLETEFIHVYKCRYENPEIIAKNEINEGRFFPFSEIEKHLGKEFFTPNFEHDFLRFFGFPAKKN